jgi:hypothetical protein
VINNHDFFVKSYRTFREKKSVLSTLEKQLEELQSKGHSVAAQMRFKKDALAAKTQEADGSFNTLNEYFCL